MSRERERDGGTEIVTERKSLRVTEGKSWEQK